MAQLRLGIDNHRAALALLDDLQRCVVIARQRAMLEDRREYKPLQRLAQIALRLFASEAARPEPGDARDGGVGTLLLARTRR